MKMKMLEDQKMKADEMTLSNIQAKKGTATSEMK